MKKEVTLVPKDECPLDVLAEMEERTANAWIFLHDNAVEKLKKSCVKYTLQYHSIKLNWDATENIPATSIIINTRKFYSGHWNFVDYIEADDIAFKHRSYDPEEIFFLQMEE